jgi:hypothetical protein
MLWLISLMQVKALPEAKEIRAQLGLPSGNVKKSEKRNMSPEADSPTAPDPSISLFSLTATTRS